MRTAFAVYDPTRTDVAALVEAIGDVGYVSTFVGEGN
jgi:hypothetical protein